MSVATGKPITILLMTQADKEAAVVERALHTFNVVIIKSQPSYANYLKFLQYTPDTIIMELPRPYHNQLHFIQLIKQNICAGSLPIICFGGKMPPDILNGLPGIGISAYLNKPLENRMLINTITEQLKTISLQLSEKITSSAKEKQFDIEQIRSSKIASSQKIDLMVKYVTETRAFSFTVSMALRLLSDERTSAGDLAKTIETDPTLSATFLKKANSVFFAGKTTRPISMKEAIVRIGFTETRRIITGMAVMQTFDTRKGSPGFNRIGFWTHCCATAKIAEKLALLTGLAHPGEAFLAGILHDFGIILLDEFFPELFSRVLQVTTDFGIRFFEAEQDLFTVTHNDLARRIFTQWDMPAGITNAIVNHYTALQPPFRNDDQESSLTRIISMANILAKTYQLGGSCDQYVTPIENSLFSSLHLTFGLPDSFYEETVAALTGYKRLLKIGGNNTASPLRTLTTHDCIGIVKLSNTLFHPVEQYLRSSGRYQLLAITGPDQYDQLQNACDIILIFADAAATALELEPLASVKKRGLCGSPKPSDSETDLFAPVIIFSGKASPCFAALNNPLFSQLPETIDLRMLELHMSNATNGTKIRILPWESLVHSTAISHAANNEWQQKIQSAYAKCRKFKEECFSLSLSSDYHTKAEQLLSTANQREQASDHETAYSLVSLATEYYRRTLLVHELSRCDKNIATNKKNIRMRNR